MNFCLDCFLTSRNLLIAANLSSDISFFQTCIPHPANTGSGVRIIFHLVCVCPQRTDRKMRDAELIESSLYYFAFLHPATHKLRNAGCGTINKLAIFVLISHPAKLILMYFVLAVNCKMTPVKYIYTLVFYNLFTTFLLLWITAVHQFYVRELLLCINFTRKFYHSLIRLQVSILVISSLNLLL